MTFYSILGTKYVLLSSDAAKASSIYRYRITTKERGKYENRF